MNIVQINDDRRRIRYIQNKCVNRPPISLWAKLFDLTQVICVGVAYIYIISARFHTVFETLEKLAFHFHEK